MMSRAQRLLMLLAALLLVPVFQLPLWSIRIVAPQYREGLGMFIGVRDIWGHAEHDIQNINILNHYIGMKPIVPAEVNLLEIFPWGLAALAGLAVVAAIVGRRWFSVGWLAVFALAGIVALQQFWMWNYDYGHNLSPDAPIKVPGMTYQPPLIGTTQLLTIRASSYPSWGTLLVMLSFVSGILALAWPRLRAARKDEMRRVAPRAVRRIRRALLPAASLSLLAVIAACGAGTGAPVQEEEAHVVWDASGEPCDFCEGVIGEARFGGVVETTDRVYRFMSVECLAGFVASGRVAESEIVAIRVVDYNHGERLIDARTAYYVQAQFERSPNGLNLVATSTAKLANNIHYFLGGRQLDWAQVVALVGEAWALPGST